jgi:hypothetical protein
MSILPRANIDPTDGLVKYIKDVKPYHTKILDIDVDYVYTDSINVTVTDHTKVTINSHLSITDVLRSCGWGIEWDPLRTTADYPKVRIINAHGQVFVDILPTASTTSLTIDYNPDRYLFTVGDAIIFTTTGRFPRVTVTEYISPGLIYYVASVQDNVITVSKTQGGPPITFYDIGSGTISIYPANIPYNAFDVESEIAPVFYLTVSDTEHHHMTFIKTYNIVGVDTATQSWIITGNQIANNNVIVGNTVFIRDNSGAGANSTFTIESLLFDGTNTIVNVAEPISIQSTVSGYMGVSYNENTQIPFLMPKSDGAVAYWPTPSWAIGTKVLISSDNQLPYPLEIGTTYFYIPMIQFGTFALSTKRYPQSISDIIDVSTLGAGILSIRRAETFYSGATVRVDSSYAERNNGVFYISSTTDYGTHVRINVVQKVNRITPTWLAYDGNMTIVSDGWDYPYYCPLVQADGLYTDVFIHEHLLFQFDEIRHDQLSTGITEVNNTVVLAVSPGSQVLLTGF